MNFVDFSDFLDFLWIFRITKSQNPPFPPWSEYLRRMTEHVSLTETDGLIRLHGPIQTGEYCIQSNSISGRP